MQRSPRDDSYFMRLALGEAAKAASAGEVPVGAVVVLEGRVAGRGRNRVEGRRDATGHAEIQALQQASRKLKRWRLNGCTVYSTLEPCAMCAGAMVLARIDRLVYAARDPKAGAAGSVFKIAGTRKLNHRIVVKHGVLEQEATELLRNFFRARRRKKGKSV